MIRLLSPLLGVWRAPGDRCNLFAPNVLLWLPAHFWAPTFVRLPAALLFVDEILFELLHRAARYVDEPAEVSGHVGQLAGTEDDQEEEPYQHHLLHADTEHGA